VQANGALTSSDTTLTVDSADPTSSTMGANWGNASHLKAGDLLLVEPSTDSLTFTQELVEVVRAISDTQVIIKRGVGGTTAAAISNDANLTLIGSAYAEGSAAPQAISRNPIKFSNYTQIFKDSYELTGTADATTFRTGDPWSLDKKRKMFDHARAIELAMFFGRKHEGTGDNGKPLRFMGGLKQQISSDTSYIFSGSATPETLLDELHKVFDFESEAGDERVAFCGNSALNALNKMILNESSTRMQWGGIISNYGLNFREFIMPQGRILLRTHPLLNRHPLHTKTMFILDFSALAYVTLKGRDTKSKDNVQNDDEDVKRGFIQTECSLMVDKGGRTCGYIGNVNYTP
jgi:hypothetical protein